MTMSDAAYDTSLKTKTDAVKDHLIEIKRIGVRNKWTVGPKVVVNEVPVMVATIQTYYTQVTALTLTHIFLTNMLSWSQVRKQNLGLKRNISTVSQ